jgi:tetratricopeptide (TPR) repeat protein
VTDISHLGSQETDRSALAESFLLTLEQFDAVDCLHGPGLVLPSAESQFALVERVLAEASFGKDHRQWAHIAARYANFVGWLHHDSGQLGEAMVWANRAFDLATEAKDANFKSYMLAYKSHIATDANRPGLALELAQAAGGVRGSAPRTLAYAANQEALAYSALGDQEPCVRAVDRAMNLTVKPPVSDFLEQITNFCHTSYVEMEAGQCWLQLGQPDAAFGVLQRSAAQYPSEFRRNFGTALARLACAHAHTGEAQKSLDTALEAVQILHETHSFRVAQSLRRTADILDKVGTRGEGADLRHAVRVALRQRVPHRPSEPDD